ncbi:MAG: endonuclease MutS2 [Acholeplasma sp.]|nr:endonuclease MutS2 [Acholeplasma sp.]
MSYSKKTLEFDIILNYVSRFAKSDSAKTIIKEMMPLETLASSVDALKATQDTLSLISRFGSFPLIEDFDIHEILDAIQIGQSLTIGSILNLRLFLSMIEDMIQYKKSYQRQQTYASIDEQFNRLVSLKQLISLIEEIMDPDGVILDSASDELYSIRKQLKKLEQQRKDLLNQILQKKSSQLNDQMIVIRNDRFCLPVKAEFKHSFKGIIHDESSSGTTIFIEPSETIEKTVEIQRLKFSEQQEIIKIIDWLVSQIRPHSESLELNMRALIELDFTQAKAKYALEINAFNPEMNDEGTVELINARHPLIDSKVVVPISLRLNKDKKTIMITGPNTGGKTVALKTVGLLSVMAQSGLLVPADSCSKLSIFKEVYADIGDEQSIAQSLSTFSSHLTKIKHIIEHVEDGVLVLLDELGSGTDPQEGSALAMGILDYLKAYDIRMIVTTHYSELKLYAYSHPHIANASVAFDVETLKPLYKIHYGISGSSNALSIASRLGLNPTVVNLAKNYTTKKENELTKSIKSFEDDSMRVKEKEVSLDQELKLLKEEKTRLENAYKELEASKDRILEATKKRADKQLKETQEKAQELLDILSLKPLKDHEIAEIKYELKQLGIEEKPISDDKTYKKGDYVHIKSYDQVGIITKVSKDQYTVKFGMFEMPFSSKDLRKSDKPVDRTKAIRHKETQKTSYSDAKMELDLRGFRFEDVKDELDKFLDTAVLNHLRSVRIIHGFGTGAVRKAVHDVLKKSPYVSEYRFGGEGEGLNGVTVVTLK